MGKSVGIDLGTTNSVVAFLEGERVETIPNSEGSKTTPSVVYYKSDEEIIVGDLAKRQALLNPESCVRSVKRIMGKRFEELKEEGAALPFRAAALPDGMAGVAIRDDVLIRPEEVSADILERLQVYAEDYLDDEVEDVVITVPAHFNDQQRTATKAAAEMIGLRVLRVINEPTAAALAYGVGKERAGRVAVFDFGGGTFDVSILHISKDIFEVLSTNGDNHLGGDDLDHVLIEYFCDQIKNSTGIDPRGQGQAYQRIGEAAERAKCELSTMEKTTISLPFIVADESGPKHFESPLTRKQFNEMMEPIFGRLTGPCEVALEDAGLSPGDVDAVLLVGGSTRIPRVQELVKELFGRDPEKSVNPDEAVAIGAALQSGIITGALREVLLLDVTPLTLGIELAGGVFKEIIPRNSTIPCEAHHKFTTVVDNQTSVLVHVLQGERKQAAENHSLAKFRLEGIPPAPKELPEIEVHFAIDANGILSVTASDLATGEQRTVRVEDYGNIGTRRTVVEKMLASAAEHEEEDLAFARFASKKSRAERIQDQANKVIEAMGDAITTEHLKSLKENMIRLDRAVMEMNERNVTHYIEEMERVLEVCRESELYKQLSRQLEDPFAVSEVEDLDESVPPEEEQDVGMESMDDVAMLSGEEPGEGPPDEEYIGATGHDEGDWHGEPGPELEATPEEPPAPFVFSAPPPRRVRRPHSPPPGPERGEHSDENAAETSQPGDEKP